MTGANENTDPAALIGAALDRLDAEQADSLVEALESGPGAAETLKTYARQKRLLRRSARALEGRAPPATEALARRLGARLRALAAGRWVGVVSTALVLGWAMGEISDRLLEPEAYYGFETADARVVEAEKGDSIELTSAQASPARLSQWIRRQVVIPDLRTSGLTFKGAHLVDTGEIRLVGLIYFGRDGELVLCQSPDLDGLTEKPELIRTANVQAGYWSDGRRTFALVAGLNRPGVRGLVQKFSRLTQAPPAPVTG